MHPPLLRKRNSNTQPKAHIALLTRPATPRTKHEERLELHNGIRLRVRIIDGPCTGIEEEFRAVPDWKFRSCECLVVAERDADEEHCLEEEGRDTVYTGLCLCAAYCDAVDDGEAWVEPGEVRF